MTKSWRFNLQDDAYGFPYHYLPNIMADGRIVIYQSLSWGLRYLTYMTYIRDRILTNKPQSICDVGCGDGRLLHMLRGVPRRVGVDLSSRAISFARAFDPNAEWYCCPVQEVPGTYDIVTCVETLEHVPNKEIPDFIASLRARTTSKGRLIVCVPTVNLPLDPKHHRHYTLELLRDQLKHHFAIQEAVWLFRIGTTTSILNRLLTNRIFVLQHAPTLRIIWRIHLRWSFFGTPSDAADLLIIASPCDGMELH